MEVDDDVKLAEGVYQSISHWGMFDGTIKEGVITIKCDSDGMALGHTFESIDEVLPLLVVEYQALGMLLIMGNHRTGLIRDRIWCALTPGALPPRDEFTSGMKFDEQKAPENVTRH